MNLIFMAIMYYSSNTKLKKQTIMMFYIMFILDNYRIRRTNTLQACAGLLRLCLSGRYGMNRMV